MLKIFFLLLVCIAVLPLQVLACPAGDEFGRPYFDIWSECYDEKTLFYEKEGHYMRRERNYSTRVTFPREAFSFPVAGPSLSTLFGYDEDEINFPEAVTAWEAGVYMDVGLANTFDAIKELAANGRPSSIMFYNVEVRRLHNEAENNEYLIRARERLDESDLTKALPHILRIEAAAVFQDVFAEMDFDRLSRTEFPTLYDPITVQIDGGFEILDWNNISVVNLDRELHEMQGIPVTLQGSPVYGDDVNFVPYTFTINESGTFVFVHNDFEFAAPPTEAAQETPAETEAGNAFLLPLIALICGATAVIAVIILLHVRARSVKPAANHGRKRYRQKHPKASHQRP